MNSSIATTPIILIAEWDYERQVKVVINQQFTLVYVNEKLISFSQTPGIFHPLMIG